MRIASGQQIPDLNEIPEAEAGLHSESNAGAIDSEGNPLSPNLLSPGTAPSEGSEDGLAQRAAMMLQDMRGGDGNDDGDGEQKDSLRRSAAEERRARRRRLKGSTANSSSIGDGDGNVKSPGIGEIPATVPEE